MSRAPRTRQNARRAARMCWPKKHPKKRPRRQQQTCLRKAPVQRMRKGQPHRVLYTRAVASEASIMCARRERKRVSVPEIRGHKNARPIVCLTCYHAHTASLHDDHVDLMLVGGSLGMVMHGLGTT